MDDTQSDNGNDTAVGRRSVLRTLGVGAVAATTGMAASTQEAAAYYDNFEDVNAPGTYTAAGSPKKKLGPVVLRYGHRIKYELVGGGTRRVRVTLSNQNRVVQRKTFTVSGSGTFTLWSRQPGHDITIERA